MNDIIINPEENDSIGNEILELADDYVKILKKIDHEIALIEEENIWFGTDWIEFRTMFERYSDSFQNAYQILQFYGNFLINASNIYKTLEEDYSKRSIRE